MLYRFLQFANFCLKTFHSPIDASVVHVCICGCAKGDAYLVAVTPPLLGVKTFSLDRDVQIQKFA
jgi:hypothetical protein